MCYILVIHRMTTLLKTFIVTFYPTGALMPSSEVSKDRTESTDFSCQAPSSPVDKAPS